MGMRLNVLIVGASRNPERYANLAMRRLLEGGHSIVLFNPAEREIDSHPVVNSLKEIRTKVDTITLYVGPRHLEPMIDDIIALAPRRIISNPGSECAAMKAKALHAGIEYLEACTLVLLAAGQF